MFFNIYNCHGRRPTVFSATLHSQPSNLPSFTLPANTLMPSTAYYTTYLDFSNRIGSTDPNGVDTTV